MGFFDRKLKQAEDDAEKVIGEYLELINADEEVPLIKKMAASGAPAGSVGNRAADSHRQIFATLIGNTSNSTLLKSRTRTQIVEQFCVALWRTWLGDQAYGEMTKALNMAQGPPPSSS